MYCTVHRDLRSPVASHLSRPDGCRMWDVCLDLDVTYAHIRMEYKVGSRDIEIFNVFPVLCVFLLVVVIIVTF